MTYPCKRKKIPKICIEACETKTPYFNKQADWCKGCQHFTGKTNQSAALKTEKIVTDYLN